MLVQAIATPYSAVTESTGNSGTMIVGRKTKIFGEKRDPVQLRHLKSHFNSAGRKIEESSAMLFCALTL
jgi:hypothetical protein